MSYSISTLLTRNLHDVFGENDPARRRAAIDEIFTEDCVFYEPKGVHRGRDEIDRVAGAIKATHPDFRYQPIAGPEELGNGGRIQWVADAILPPSTTIACPVMNAASSLVKNRTAPVTSSGSSIRLMACCSQVARFWSSDCGAVARVFVRPGNTAFAVIPSFATSFANSLMNPIMPIFVA